MQNRKNLDSQKLLLFIKHRIKDDIFVEKLATKNWLCESFKKIDFDEILATVIKIASIRRLQKLVLHSSQELHEMNALTELLDFNLYRKKLLKVSGVVVGCERKSMVFRQLPSVTVLEN